MKAIVFTVLFVIMSVISGIAEGGGSFNATRLNGDITATEAAVINVDSTAGFLDPLPGATSYIVIGDEYIAYTGTTATSFNAGLVRGVNETTAVKHTNDDWVYSGDTSVLNAMLGYNTATTGTTIGAVTFATQVGAFIFKALPRLLSWDFNYLKIGSMVYLRILLWALSGAFVISLLPYLLQAASGILQTISRIL